MDMKKTRNIVLEIVKIAQECPENLQEKCFGLLLANTLGESKSPKVESLTQLKDSSVTGKPNPTNVVEETGEFQEDIAQKDIHVKTRKFMKKNDITLVHINQLFYKEGEHIKTLYDDLQTTRTSESQIRIALLQCLNNAISNGAFTTTVESTRDEATTRKCNDRSNWGNNFTNRAGLFDFEKYYKGLNTITLSEEGKTELATVIKELQ